MCKHVGGWMVIVVLCGAVVAGSAAAAEEPKDTKWVPAVKPKPLSESVQRGLGWLVEQQIDNGAWGQGEESQQMGGGAKLKDVPSVADTCIATLALLRAGNTPSQGTHAKAVRRAVEFVCSEVEKADKDSLSVTGTQGTRVQAKLGPYIDTFLTSMLLSEVQEKMPDDEGNDRVSSALDKVLHKLAKNQQKDGTWDNRGWAPTLAQAMAVKGINRAVQAGKEVDSKVLDAAADESRARFSAVGGTFSDGGSAGVQLYAAASALGGQQDSVNTAASKEAELKTKLDVAKTEPEKTQIQEQLARIEVQKKDLVDVRSAVVAKLEDQRFIAGFGSNGGEEFLSYMNIGESLVVKGGPEWDKWDKSMTENLGRVQNKDGSWTGHHCITGRTFCTASALMVLMVDRAPVPVAARIRR